MQPIQKDYSDFISPSCGKAWLSGIALGNLSVDISTGFELNAGDAAIFYYWNVYLSDAGGTSHQDFGPSGLAERRSWSGHRTVGGLSPSNGRTWIDSSSSYAALIDGAYCYLGPVPSTTASTDTPPSGPVGGTSRAPDRTAGREPR